LTAPQIAQVRPVCRFSTIHIDKPEDVRRATDVRDQQLGKVCGQATAFTRD
jgi:hypothetical protein